MPQKDEVLRLTRSRIAYELKHKHEVPAKIADRLVEKGVFDAYSLHAVLLRLEIMAAALGDIASGVVIQCKPRCIGFPMENLQPLIEFLVSKGFQLSDARRMVTVWIGLVQRDLQSIAETYASIAVLIGDLRATRVFIAKYPCALLLPAAHVKSKTDLRWTNELEVFWSRLIVGFDMRTIESHIEESAATKRLNPDERNTYERLRMSGIEDLNAAKVAVKLTDLVGTNGPEVLDTFALAGWTMSDVIDLVYTNQNRAWIADPSRLFRAELALIEALQISQRSAREIVIRRREYSENDLTPIRAAADAFRAGGMRENLPQIARMEPQALLLPDERITSWLQRKKFRSPMAGLSSLVRSSLRPTHCIAPPAAPAPVVPTVPRAPIVPVMQPRPIPRRPPPAPPPPPPPKPEPQDDENGDEELVARPDDDDDEAELDSHLRDWKKNIETILTLTPLDGDGNVLESWEAFSQKPENQLLWDSTGNPPKVLGHLALWTGLGEKPTSASPVVLFFARILRDPKMRPILTVTAQALHHRLATIRKLLDRDFMKDPGLLLLPFERIPADELRFRVNELTARKGVIGDLFAPTRKEFLERVAEREQIAREEAERYR